MNLNFLRIHKKKRRGLDKKFACKEQKVQNLETGISFVLFQFEFLFLLMKRLIKINNTKFQMLFFFVLFLMHGISYVKGGS